MEPTVDETGRVRPEYLSEKLVTHLSLGHLGGPGMKRADKGDLYDESKLAWSVIPMVGEDPCWICTTEKMTNRHMQIIPTRRTCLCGL